MADTKTLTHNGTETERSTITFPAGLWTKARKLAIDLGIPANRLVVEGLEIRISQLKPKVQVTR